MKHCWLFLLMAGLLTSVAHADTLEPLDDTQELSTRICLLSTQGIYLIASEHQAGKSKAQTKKLLEKEYKQLQSSVSDKQFAQSMYASWLRGLDIIYQQPIQQTEADKQAFITGTLEISLNACLNDMEN